MGHLAPPRTVTLLGGRSGAEAAERCVWEGPLARPVPHSWPFWARTSPDKLSDLVEPQFQILSVSGPRKVAGVRSGTRGAGVSVRLPAAPYSAPAAGCSHDLTSDRGQRLARVLVE